LGNIFQPIGENNRQLTEEEIELINEIEMHGEQLDALINKIRKLERIDRRWVNLATDDLQTGIMKLIRSVTKTTGF